MITKVCTKCGEEKLLERFSKQKDCLHGRRNECKNCYNARLRKWYSENSGRVNYERRIIREAEVDRFRGYANKWGEQNPDAKRESANRYYYNGGKEKQLEYSKVWAKEQSDKLTDRYIMKMINNVTGMSWEEIKQHPELIEDKRELIKAKRILKQLKQKSC